jgi:fluoride ion exporter CrcB/FEX
MRAPSSWLDFWASFTPSQFSYETTTLFQGGQALAAIANIALQVGLGVGVTLISYNLVQRI